MQRWFSTSRVVGYGEYWFKRRLLADVKQNFSAKVIDFFSSKENADESILRTVLRAENMDISRGKFIPGMGEFRSYICKCNDSINIFSEA